MKLTFYDRNNVVQARISDGQKQIRISTGIHIGSRVFNKKFLGTGKDIIHLNKTLKSKHDELINTYKKYGDVRNVDSLIEVDPSDFDIVSLCDRYVKMMPKMRRQYAKSTISTYGNVVRNIKLFGRELDISKFNIDQTMSSVKKKELKAKFESYFTEFENWMIDRNYKIKTRMEIMNVLGHMVRYWAKDNFFNIPDVPRLQNYEKPIVVLPPEFVPKFISSSDVYISLDREMKYTWQVCATILVTSLRFSDAHSLSKNDLIITKDGMMLNKMNKKTGELSQMPLPKLLSDIFEENIQIYGRPYNLSDKPSIIYKNIRELFKKYEELHTLVSITTKGVRGEDVIETKPLYEWVHPHMLRKTAITTMIYYGVDHMHVKHASGHTQNSDAYWRYVKVVERLFTSDFNQAHKKMFYDKN
jgi:integrase